ncbi:MAG: amidohydrolase family protein [Rhodospirillaceae bacterium]
MTDTPIIDCHGHVTAPAALKDYRNWLIATDGSDGKGEMTVSDDDIAAALEAPAAAGVSHLDGLEAAQIDIQLISPRPNQMMHSRKPASIVRWYAEAANDLIHRQCQLWPGKFYGVAGLPQAWGEPISLAIEELERCVTELGFKGCMINPDPSERSDPDSPPVWDEYWYPLFEKICELDIPCLIHATGPKTEREYYNHYYIHEETVAVLGFVGSKVLDDFPGLNVVLAHGGGSFPFQIGRFVAAERKYNNAEIGDRIERLYFDTVLHDNTAVAFLIERIGADNVVFGTEWPGLGSTPDPDTGRMMDDLVPGIRAIETLSDGDKANILGGTAQRLFRL